MCTGEIEMKDSMTEAKSIFTEIGRIAAKTITGSRKDKERIISLIAKRISISKREAHDMGRRTMKRDVSGVIRPCLDRDFTLQKLMSAIEELE